MIFQPDIDPVAFRLGGLSIYWYGISYVAGLLLAMRWGIQRARQDWRQIPPDWVENIIFYGALGVVFGGRIGYVLFYTQGTWWTDPLQVFWVQQGGMSFHGGLIGVLIAMAIFAHRHHRTFWQITDFIAPLVPIGLGLGRIANFINGELWGKVTDAPWGVVFRGSDGVPRHPSQLYEAFLEGFVLLLLLTWFSSKPRQQGQISGLFLIGYGISRFLVEFVRLPDAQLGYLAWNWLTMGQVLTLPMIFFGLWLLCRKSSLISR